MMRAGRRTVLGAGAAALLVAPARAATDPGVLRYGLSNYPATLRPFAQAGNSGNAVKLTIHRTLASYSNAGDVQPELATWTQPDDRTFVFDLREASFHNGDPVTAADVKWSLNEIRKPNSTAFLKSNFAVIDQVVVEGPRRVRVLLNAPCATFLNLVASGTAPVLSAKSADLPPETPIGCGPYRSTERLRGEHIRVERFDRYHKPGLPKMGAIDFVAYSDENLRQAALESGDLDIIEAVPWQSIAGLKTRPELSVQSGIGGYFYLKFNFNAERFRNPKVRQAIGLAVDRPAITKIAFFDEGAPLYGLPIPDGPLFPDAEAGRPFQRDVTRAKQLLTEAGCPDGFNATIMSLNDPGTFERACLVVQANVAEIGINLELLLLDYATLTSRGDRGTYEFGLYGATGFFNDPDAVSVMISGPPNYLRSFGFKSARVETLLADGRSTLDPAKRKAIYLELQQACFEEGPLIGLSWRNQAYAMKKGLTGFEEMPYFLNAYSPFELESVSRATS